MTIIGSDGGDALRGSLQFGSHEESVGGMAAARYAMGIVQDTLELPLLSVHKETRKYQSSSNRPVLTPLYTTRIATGFEPVTDESWKAVYKEMVEQLPKDFRAFFESAMQLNEDKRNRNITILDRVMQSCAKLLGNLRIAAAPMDAESLAAERALDNITQTYIAFNALALNGALLVSEGFKFLELIGPNDPNFDRVAGTLGEFALIAEDLKTATILLTNSDTQVEAKQIIATAYEQIATLSTQYDRLGGGGDFLLLGHLFHAAELCCAALLLERPGAAALLFGLSNATFDMDKSTSTLGLLGAGYAAFSHTLADSLGSVFFKGGANGELGRELIETTLLTALLWGALSYDAKIAQQDPKGESPAEIAERNLAHELTLRFLTGTGVLSTIGNIIAKESGVDASRQTPMAALLEASMLLMLIAPSIKGGDLTGASSLLKGISEQLDTTLALGASGLEGTTNTYAISTHFKVYLQQAAIALENNDEEALINALGNALELTGTTTSQFIADVKDLKGTAHGVVESIDQSGNLTANTGITQAA